MRLNEQTNHVVKLGRELLRLEKLNLLVGEARVLVGGRPLQQKQRGISAAILRSQIRRVRTIRRDAALGRWTATAS
jgi:hypothetical protein